MKFKIEWVSQYGKEIIDIAKDFKEAKFLKKEYKIAYNEGYFNIIRLYNTKNNIEWL